MKVQAAKVGDIPENGSIRITEGVPEPIALFKLPSGFYAISDTCTHAESSLSEGFVDVDEQEIECDLHGARFHIPTGEVRAFPATQPVNIYPTTVEDDTVVIEVESNE
jgi:3-phenylpropionate/trans-cinnamate dioxygenase ferredoxin component